MPAEPSFGREQVGLSRWASPSTARHTFIALAIGLLPIMVLSSFDFGVTWDEKERHKNGEFVWQFLRGLRSRSSFAETGGHLYPGLFDVICAALETWLPAERYVLRHVVNATFGWVGILYCGRLAARLVGPWAGVLALALLALSPRYFADSMNNPKDLPFAAMTMVATYYISTAAPRWPYVSLSTAIKIAVSIGLALNIRVGAVLYLGYFGLLIAGFVLLERNTNWRRLADTGGRVLGVAVALLLLGTVFWPWAGAAPLIRPFQALLRAADAPWNGVVLFEGYPYSAAELPWYYALWWLLISTPPVVLGGAVGSLVFWSTGTDLLRRLALWIIVVIPFAAAILMHSTLYDGIRHLEFTYPPLVVLAAMGWAGALTARSASLRGGAVACVSVGLASLLIFHVRFHPNQGVYFNSLVGGPRGAFSRYDMDYWGNCMLQAVEWTAQQARASGTVMTISGNPWHLVQLNAQRFREVAFAYPSRDRHYLHIQLARGPGRALRKLANEPALYQVKTPDGAVLCTVVPGPAFSQWETIRPPTAPSLLPSQAGPQ